MPWWLGSLARYTISSELAYELEVKGSNPGISILKLDFSNFQHGCIWTRITSLSATIVVLNPTEVEMKISNFIFRDDGCKERMI